MFQYRPPGSARTVRSKSTDLASSSSSSASSGRSPSPSSSSSSSSSTALSHNPPAKMQVKSYGRVSEPSSSSSQKSSRRGYAHASTAAELPSIYAGIPGLEHLGNPVVSTTASVRVDHDAESQSSDSSSDHASSRAVPASRQSRLMQIPPHPVVAMPLRQSSTSSTSSSASSGQVSMPIAQAAAVPMGERAGHGAPPVLYETTEANMPSWQNAIKAQRPSYYSIPSTSTSAGISRQDYLLSAARQQYPGFDESHSELSRSSASSLLSQTSRGFSSSPSPRITAIQGDAAASAVPHDAEPTMHGMPLMAGFGAQSTATLSNSSSSIARPSSISAASAPSHMHGVPGNAWNPHELYDHRDFETEHRNLPSEWTVPEAWQSHPALLPRSYTSSAFSRSSTSVSTKASGGREEPSVSRRSMPRHTCGQQASNAVSHTCGRRGSASRSGKSATSVTSSSTNQTCTSHSGTSTNASCASSPWHLVAPVPKHHSRYGKGYFSLANTDRHRDHHNRGGRLDWSTGSVSTLDSARSGKVVLSNQQLRALLQQASRESQSECHRTTKSHKRSHLLRLASQPSSTSTSISSDSSDTSARLLVDSLRTRRRSKRDVIRAADVREIVRAVAPIVADEMVREVSDKVVIRKRRSKRPQSKYVLRL